MNKKQKISKIHKKVLHYYAKNHRIIHHNHHNIAHLGELILVGIIGFASLLFAGSIGLPENTSFAYPLKQISTLDCRTIYREEMPDSCKINLPIIQGANYENYEDSVLHRQIYTTLRAAPYKDARNQKVGAHAGVDIATARGTPIYSIGDGEVILAGGQGGYGNVIRVKYLFKGKYIYALYVHMDTIQVKAGDIVKKGDKIGTVGNTGIIISGGLGGYHLHFQLDKDHKGRRVDSYKDCPDINTTSRYQIIQTGLCRGQLFDNTYDPIKVLEANALLSSDLPITPPQVISGSNNTGTNQTGVSEMGTVVNTGIMQSGTINNNTSGTVTDINNAPHITGAESQDHNSAGGEVLEPATTHQEQPEIEVTQGEKPENSNQEPEITITPETKRVFDMNTEQRSPEIKHFLSQRSLFASGIDQDQIIMDTEFKTIPIYLQNKTSKKNFVGVLPYAITLITDSDNTKINFNTVQLLEDGKIDLQLTKNKIGSTTLLVQINNITIGKLYITTK